MVRLLIPSRNAFLVSFPLDPSPVPSFDSDYLSTPAEEQNAGRQVDRQTGRYIGRQTDR
jgi:hypothetical protein